MVWTRARFCLEPQISEARHPEQKRECESERVGVQRDFCFEASSRKRNPVSPKPEALNPISPISRIKDASSAADQVV